MVLSGLWEICCVLSWMFRLFCHFRDIEAHVPYWYWPGCFTLWWFHQVRLIIQMVRYSFLELGNCYDLKRSRLCSYCYVQIIFIPLVQGAGYKKKNSFCNKISTLLQIYHRIFKLITMSLLRERFFLQIYRYRVMKKGNYNVLIFTCVRF